MFDPEPIAAALLAKLATIPAVAYTSRKRRHPDQLPDQPALTLVIDNFDVAAELDKPSRWSIYFTCNYLQRFSEGKEDTSETALNAFVVQAQQALQPDTGQSRQDLGGVCQWVLISGGGEFVQATTDWPWAEVALPIEAVGFSY